MHIFLFVCAYMQDYSILQASTFVYAVACRLYLCRYCTALY